MKKLLLINIVLIISYYSIPGITKIEINATKINMPISIEVNRHEEYVLKYKNYNLTVDTDLRLPTNLTAADYEQILPKNLKGIGQALEQAESDYKVNGIYLIGLACQESGRGTSDFAKYRNNITGFCAYDTNPNNASYFESYSECILQTARLLNKYYLKEDAKWYGGGYTIKNVDVFYCTDDTHADRIVDIANELVKGVE